MPEIFLLVLAVVSLTALFTITAAAIYITAHIWKAFSRSAVVPASQESSRSSSPRSPQEGRRAPVTPNGTQEGTTAGSSSLPRAAGRTPANPAEELPDDSKWPFRGLFASDCHFCARMRRALGIGPRGIS